jgi:2-iminobutanoate/2-iminopropanoate deaminase
MKEVINTEAAPAAAGPYSQAVRAGDFLFISGQIGIDPSTGAMVEGGIQQQTEQALVNIRAILDAAGADMSSIVKTTVFLQSIEDFGAMNGVYKGFFSGDFPARAAFEVGGLPLGAQVEIEAVAHIG